MALTPEEKRQARMDELKAAREKKYFEAQEAAKTAAEKKLPPLPEPDAYIYDYAWRQDVGGPGGQYKLIKTENPYYDPATNTILDPVTGIRTPMVPSMYGGTTVKTTATTPIVKTTATTPIVTTTATTPIVSTTATTPVSTTPVTPTGLTASQAKSLSAFEVFRGFLNQYGLGALAADVEKYKLDGLSDDEMLIRLRTESAAYKRRFAANEARVAKGLAALSEAAYIGLEDQYQDVMRRYGLPETYYTRGEMGRQEGFEKFIAGDVSPVELEDRIQTAYNRVINANPEVGIALRQFYPGITNGDILAYTLDPDKALNEIQRKITAAEIGGAAVQAGLTTNLSDAEYLARYGVTKEQAQQGYRTISGYLPRAQQLSSIYGKQVEGGPYTQASAEREVFNVPGAAEEERKRLKITQLEQAAFSGQSGLTGGALGRERAGQF